jgi:sugar phosphate isomerase/epimerase
MQRFRLGAVTDLFSPDIAAAAPIMHQLEMRGAELRTAGGRSILELNDSELDRAHKALAANQLEVVAIASPLFKCPLDSPAWEEQQRLAERAFQVALRTGAKIVRAFSGRRVVDPGIVFERVVDALQELADRAGKRGLIIGLENDPGCNIATGHELAGVLAAIDHSNLQVIWDPANAYLAGEKPFPAGYRMVDTTRIAHIHAKDCTLDGHKPVWMPLGEGDIDWQGQIDALAEDGYEGFIHIEMSGPGGQTGVLNLKKMIEPLAL